jgi:2-polyprenyl-3-methyl-5-hydroxy-6-metoxy-1,4-benzoquinol methylase
MGSNESALVTELVGPNRSVLDCGCGHGAIARLLTANGCDVVGIEAEAARAELARTACGAVVTGDLERAETLAEARRHRSAYDCIICSHVLEHLRDPSVALRQLVTLIRPGGAIVIALPNVAHWHMRWTLLRGRWDYQDAGILDATHLRFFTYKSALALISGAGLRVERAVVPDFIGPTLLHTLARRASRAITPVSLFSSSFVFRCTLR